MGWGDGAGWAQPASNPQKIKAGEVNRLPMSVFPYRMYVPLGRVLDRLPARRTCLHQPQCLG